MNTCGRLDEHAKERKSFTKQAYAPGLKGPGPLGRIDFGNPALKPMLRMMADNMKKDTRAYHPPEGLRLRSLSVDNGNGRQIWCFVMEPEGEETRSLPGMLYCHGGGFFLPLQVPALRSTPLHCTCGYFCLNTACCRSILHLRHLTIAWLCGGR